MDLRILILWNLCSFSVTAGADVTVVTDLGTIIGEVFHDSFNGTPLAVSKFLGIPFAEPPTGNRRFQRPVKKAAFTQSFIAKTVSPACMQNKTVAGAMSEDCLYLNIIVPGVSVSVTEKKAVMVWIYGGAFQVGSQDTYTSLIFPTLNDVILVTLNYRLSAFGFLSTGNSYLPGNYGLWDQHMAIQWVHEHIDKFGGDPNNVTIFGVSAGGASAILQALYDGNQGLFQRVIAQSGTANAIWVMNKHPETDFDKLVNESNCIVGSVRSVIRCLRNKTAIEIQFLMSTSSGFFPVQDGVFVKENPVDIFQNKSETAWEILKFFGKFDLLIGVNSAEGGMYMPYVDYILSAQGKETANGYTRDDFENILIPFAVTEVMYSKLTPVLQMSLIHQYTDWRNPYNTSFIRQSTLDLVSDVNFNAAAFSTANVHSNTDGPGRLFTYIYDHKLSTLPERWYSGASHGEELIMVFGLGSASSHEASKDPANFFPSSEVLLSRQIMEYWTNFAKSG